MKRPKSILTHSLSGTFNLRRALFGAIIGGTLLTLITLMSHIDRNWHLSANYHFVFALISNILLLFLILTSIFAVIRQQISTRWKYVLCIVSSIVIALITTILSGLLHKLIYNDLRFSDPDSVNFIRDLMVALVAILITLVIFNIIQRHEMRLEKEQLQNENLMVRYEALEHQLDPHFLFNSLNTLSGLIGNDDQSAQQYLMRLASTYRYIMQAKRLVDLEKELAFVDSYCQMMQIRYGDNLRIVKQIDPRYLHWQILPISLQQLVENAIKHNVISDRHPLTITLETTGRGTFLVTNPIQNKKEPADGTGLGLVNLSKRYSLICHREIVIADTGNIFTVEVPLISAAESSIINSETKPAKQ